MEGTPGGGLGRRRYPDQIVDGTGVLLPDPADLAAFGSQVRRLLDNPGEAERMGKAGQAHIRENYVGDRHLLRWNSSSTPSWAASCGGAAGAGGSIHN